MSEPAPRCEHCNGPLALDADDTWHCADCGAGWPDEPDDGDTFSVDGPTRAELYALACEHEADQREDAIRWANES